MKERPKTGAFLLIAVAILCIYILKSSFYPIEPSTGAASYHLPSSVGARLVFNEPINVNIATEKELELLPGIGPVLARRIVEARSQSSGFSTIRELERVKGLSPARVKKLAPYITIDR